MTTNLELEYYYRYSICLRSIGENDKANEMMAKFNQSSRNDSRAKLFDKNRNYLEEIKENSGRYEIEDAGVNF